MVRNPARPLDWTRPLRQIPEALSDWRGVHTEGEKLTDEGKARWQERVRRFLGKVPQHTGKQAPKKEVLCDPKLANIHDLRAWDHTLSETFGFGLAKFAPATKCQQLAPRAKRFWVQTADLPSELRQLQCGRKRRACIQHVCGRTSFEIMWAEERPIIHCWLDMGSIGWPAKQAAFLGCGFRGSWGFDPAHRRWDNILNSLKCSGLSLIRLEALTVQAFTSGPFHGDANFRKLEEAIKEWCSSHPEGGEPFDALYYRITRDLHAGVLPPEFGTKSHRAEMWRKLPSLAEKCIYGMNTKMNRWFQLVRRHRSMAPYWGLALAGALYVCIQKGHFANLEETPFLHHTREVTADASTAQGVAGPSSRAPPATSRSVQWSNQELNHIRSSCSGGFHLAATILCMDETRAVMTAVSSICDPVMRLHGQSIVRMKTRRAVSWV